MRAIAPNYFRPPTKDEQLQYEMSLKGHLKSYARFQKKWDAITVGANDVPLDALGNAAGVPPEEPPELDYNALYGGDGSDEIPWFFQGKRQIPNIASFKVPDFAVITNRIARKAGLALIGTFVGDNGPLRDSPPTRAWCDLHLKPRAARPTWVTDQGWELPLGSDKRAHAAGLSDKGIKRVTT